MPTLAELERLRRASLLRFTRTRRAETWYGRQLRRVARAIDDLVKGIVPAGADEIDPTTAAALQDILERYAGILGPWAEIVARRMLSDVSVRDIHSWVQLGREMRVDLRREIQTAPTGQIFRQGLRDQVGLITSLPREAALRVHRLTTEALTTGRRAADIAKEILASGEVSIGRANTIARTEVGRTATEFLRARSEHIGSPGYIWLTAGDADVRPVRGADPLGPNHRRLQGQFVPWNQPPIVDRRTGRRAHAGQDVNCRCTPIPTLPAELTFKRAA
jgi:SPP1 gp7 family putative phage head morphogenesis protein